MGGGGGGSTVGKSVVKFECPMITCELELPQVYSNIAFLQAALI